MQHRLKIVLVFCFCIYWCLIHSDEPMTLGDIVQKEFIGKKSFDEKTFNKTWKFVRNHGPFLKYQIIENVPYGPPSRVLSLLQVLCQKYQIPNLEFIYYYYDLMPDYLAQKAHQFAPIFVSARKKSHDHYLLFADWYYDVNDHNSESAWNALYEKIHYTGKKLSWSERIPKLVWRGATNDGIYSPDNWTSFPRGHLVYLSKSSNGEFIDAEFAGYHPWNVSDMNFFEKNLGVFPLSPHQQALFKYQIDIDGVTATFTSLPWKMLTGSLVFKQKSEHIMWFHHALASGKHYVEVDSNLQNIFEMLNWHGNMINKLSRSQLMVKNLQHIILILNLS